MPERSIITDSGLEKHKGERVTLHIWGEKPGKHPIYRGRLGEDENGFFVRKGHMKYRIKEGRTVSITYPKTDGTTIMRHFDVKNYGPPPTIGIRGLKKNVGEEALLPWNFKTRGELGISEDQDKKIHPFIITDKEIYPIEEIVSLLHQNVPGKPKERLFKEYKVEL